MGSVCKCFSINHGNVLEADMRANREINGNMRRNANMNSRTRKLLLLGAGSSGKSTLLKQMRYLYVYQQGYPDSDLLKYKDIIFENVIRICAKLSKQCQIFKYDNDPDNAIFINKLLLSDIKEHLLGFDTIEELQNCIEKVWCDPGIKKTFQRRHEFTLIDNALYLMENIDRMLTDDYIPTFMDIVYTRSQTTGINKETFIFQKSKGKSQKERYELVDVGGQKTERRKWISCFSDVIGVLFVIALSGYDQVLWEDNNINRFEDALDLLNQTIKEKALSKAKFIIFLNKKDIFKNKLQSIPFKYKKEYGPSSDYDEIIEWIKSTIRNFDINRDFYFNITCATDTQDVDRTFQICHDIVLRNAIQKGGFM